jgi:hypothetical protein
VEYCAFPIYQVPSKARRAFLKDLSQKAGMDFMDLSDDFMAVGLTYLPYSLGFGEHFTDHGMDFMNTVLLRELLRTGKIPYLSKAPAVFPASK